MSDGPFEWVVVTEPGDWARFGHDLKAASAFAKKLKLPEPVRLEDPAAAVAAERARCRAIVFKLFGKDYTGNQALAEIDRGGR